MKRVAFILAVLGFAFSAPAVHAAPTPGNNPAVTAPTQAQAPSLIIKAFYDKLFGVMKDGEKLGFAGRAKALTPSIKSAFNLPVMTRFAVGPVWAQATPDQQTKLISAFSDFSVANYASRFAKYDGEKFQVLGETPASGGGTIVETTITPGGADAKPVSINYLMKKDEKGSWRIVDVLLEGAISELATRRSEFSSIVERDGIPALVNDLGTKSRELGPS